MGWPVADVQQSETPGQGQNAAVHQCLYLSIPAKDWSRLDLSANPPTLDGVTHTILATALACGGDAALGYDSAPAAFPSVPGSRAVGGNFRLVVVPVPRTDCWASVNIAQGNWPDDLAPVAERLLVQAMANLESGS
ncbi:hypothetical protein [Nonomuraea sp. SYSU D8015]|uniref:hypothetical protein n=1 Tax=Nonomuraea sp. SYSU D8015 TaxID=2593644 RepID=UPI001660A57E|nr:hypothetical protein [Nonomuraea sp. SYSU D8015]